VRDRQYVSSLAVTAAVLTLSLAALVSVPLWLGWAGAACLLAIAGGFLIWFYRGPRPDLPARGWTDGGERSDSEQ